MSVRIGGRVGSIWMSVSIPAWVAFAYLVIRWWIDHPKTFLVCFPLVSLFALYGGSPEFAKFTGHDWSGLTGDCRGQYVIDHPSWYPTCTAIRPSQHQEKDD